jgi:hypothetical protein
VRKYLGVLTGALALCIASWAQTPTPDQTPVPPPATTTPTDAQAPVAPAPATPVPATPSSGETPAIPIATPAQKPEAPAIKYPRFELFAGGSYAEAGLFNAGHWAGLPGWDASIALNATHWLGFIVDGGQMFGTSKISSLQHEPFPPCQGTPSYCPTSSPTFDVKTREYNFLVGAQFSRRKYELWTPFGELLYGHQGTRGEVPGFTEIGTGRALIAGGGIDRKINERFALRFKADYLQTSSQFPTFAHKKQDNFRFSVGIVIRNVHKKKRTLEDETQVEP